MHFYVLRRARGAGRMHFFGVAVQGGGQDACIFTCSGVPGEQDVCIFYAVIFFSEKQDACIFMGSGASGEQDVCILAVFTVCISACI